MSTEAGVLTARWVRTIERAKAALRGPATIYLAASVLSRVGAIVLIPIYTRKLAPAEYGTYALFVSLLSLLPQCLALGLSAGLSKAFFDAPDDDEGLKQLGAVARGIVLVASATALVCLGLVLLFAPAQGFLLPRRHLVLVTVGAWAVALTSIPDTSLRIRERALHAAGFQLLNFVTSALAGILLVVGFDRGLEGAVEAPTIAALVCGSLSLFFTFRVLGAAPVGPALRRALVISIPFVPHFLAGWFQAAGDRWVISAFSGEHKLGTYFLATQLMSPVPMVLSAWNQAEWPRMGRLSRAEGLVGLRRQLWSFERRSLLAAFVPCFGIALAAPLLPIFIGQKFLGAVALMPAIGACHLVDSFYYPDSNALVYAGRTRLIPVFTAGSAALGLGLALLLLPRFGVPGLLGARLMASVAQASAFALTARAVRGVAAPVVAGDAAEAT